MSIALVDHTAAGLGTNGGTSPAINTTGATLIVVAISSFAAIPGTGSLADSKGNTWIALDNTSTAERLFYCSSPIVGSGHTFTVTITGSYSSVAVLAFSGVSGVPDLNLSQGANHPNPALTPPAHDNELLVSTCYIPTAPGTVTGGFTIVDSVPFVGGTYVGVQSGYLIQTTATALDPVWSGGSHTTLASFQPTAVVPTPVSNTAVVRAETLKGVQAVQPA